MGNSHLDLLLHDCSNYNSWCTHIFNVLKTIDPMLLSIIDVSICPSNFDWDNFSEEEGKCLQLNAQATYVLTSAMSAKVQDVIFEEYGFLEDAHLIWNALKEKYYKLLVQVELLGIEIYSLARS